MSLTKVVSDYKATRPKDINDILEGYTKYHDKLLHLYNETCSEARDNKNREEMLKIKNDFSVAIANLNDVKEKKLSELS